MNALVENQFDRDLKLKVSLLFEKKILQEIPVSLKSGNKRKINFSPIIPETAGPKRYRVLVEPPDGDSDSSNNSDTLLVLVKPPDQFTTLYLSNNVHPLFPFLKRVLANEERFDFKALVRLVKVFHALEKVLNLLILQIPDFWMSYDTIILDTGTFDDLNESLVLSLKDFCSKKKREVCYYLVS